MVISFDTMAREAGEVRKEVVDHFVTSLCTEFFMFWGMIMFMTKMQWKWKLLRPTFTRLWGCLIPGVMVILNADRRDMNEDPSSRKPVRAGRIKQGSFLNKLRALFPGFKRKDDAVREVLEELIEDDEVRSIDSHERLLLGNVLHLRDVTAYDVMVPPGRYYSR